MLYSQIAALLYFGLLENVVLTAISPVNLLIEIPRLNGVVFKVAFESP